MKAEMLEGTNIWHETTCKLPRRHRYEVIRQAEDKIAIELETSRDSNEKRIA